MTHEEDHAHAAGYTSIKSWRERMKVLEAAGFIKTFSRGHRYAKVFIVHPAIAMKALFDLGKVPAALWEPYRARQIESKELGAEAIREERRT
jgi:hypothetical protein